MDALQPGDPSEIGGYRLLARLGAGGMGEVFLARTASGRPLAVKTVHPDLSRAPEFAERFAREIRTSDRVRSPWTVSVVDFSPPGQSPQWLATEYITAPSLGDWVQRRGPLPEPAVRCLARELATALVAVRKAGVVHRDLKPGNILLGLERPFLIDFGISRAVRDPRHTQTGAVIGTPGYLAPEQASGAVAAAPADVFSLAAVLVYAATGHSPFMAAGEEIQLPAILYRIVHDEPFLDGMPESLAPLVRECLAKAPDTRPTADEVLARVGDPDEGTWGETVPSALVSDVGHREVELRRLIADPQPPVSVPWSAAGSPAAAPESPAVPSPGAPPAPPAAFVAPTFRAPAPERGAWRALGPRVIAAAAGVAVLTTAAIALQTRFSGDGDGGGAPHPGPSSTSSSSSDALPAEWVGTWTGVGPGTPDADGITRPRTREFAVTVTLRPGTVGDFVGQQVSELTDIDTGRNLGCTEALELRRIRRNTVILAAVTSRPSDRSAPLTCPQGNVYMVTKTEANRLTLESEGAQSVGAPSFLTRRR